MTGLLHSLIAGTPPGDPHDAVSGLVAAKFPIFEEEIDTALRPSHATVTVGELALPTASGLKFNQKPVEPVEVGLARAHPYRPATCL